MSLGEQPTILRSSATIAPRTSDLPALSVEGYLRFSQAGWNYLLPARLLIAVIGAEHLRPLARPVQGWAGTVSMRGGVLPVLDTAQLLGHGAAPGALMLLRLPTGPLGLTVDRLEALDPLPYTGLATLTGALGIEAGLATASDVSLAISERHLDRLRQQATADQSSGRREPRPVTWEDGATTLLASAEPEPVESLRIGEPLIVLADRLLGDVRRSLALPLSAVRAVARAAATRPGPPGITGVVGFAAWGRRAIPCVSPQALGVAREVRGESRYAVVLSNSTVLLVSGVRGVQGLTHFDPPTGDGTELFRAFGDTRGRRAGERIGVGEVEVLSETGTSGPTPVAVLSPARLTQHLRGVDLRA